MPEAGEAFYKVEYDPETKLYVGIAEGLPGVHSQGATLAELGRNMREVLELCLEENPDLRDRMPTDGTNAQSGCPEEEG